MSHLHKVDRLAIFKSFSDKFPYNVAQKSG